MKKINVSNYFYLVQGKQIKKEEITSGATLFNGKWITNYNESKNIEVKENNKLSLYVPSTINVNEINKNFEKVINKVQEKINQKTTRNYTQGAWREEKGNLVYEDICILTIDVVADNFEKKLNDFITIANELKQELTQEGISIGINNGLMII